MCVLLYNWIRSDFFLQLVELENLDKRLLNIRRVVQGLPQANFDILRRVSEHLDKYVVLLLIDFE